MRWLAVLVAISACGKSGDDRKPSSDKPPAAAPVPTPSPPPVATPDAAQPARPPTPEERARAALDEGTAVLAAFTAAIGKDRCKAKKQVDDAIAANAEHIKHVHDTLADPAVKPIFSKLDAPAFKAALDQWMATQIEGTCKVDADIKAFSSMLPS